VNLCGHEEGYRVGFGMAGVGGDATTEELIVYQQLGSSTIGRLYGAVGYRQLYF